MQRSPVSVVLIASGSPDDLRACLEALRPQLRPRDEVVAVVPEAARELEPVLRQHRWVRSVGRVTGSAARARDAGIAAAHHDIALILDGDTILGAHCLDAVIAPFADDTVVAAGPRCHHSYGPQYAELAENDLTSVRAFQRRARAWREEHRGVVSDVAALGPVVSAVRCSVLAEALPAAADVPESVPWPELRALGRIVVVDEALAAHAGRERCVLPERLPDTPDLPLLSASLIVKDEEDLLADCLRSLDGLVDEIVVYDTGSTDRTKEIARDHGARVIDGYWDDSFGDARNRSLTHCRGRWVLVIDADEVAVCEPEALRATLRGADPATECVVVEIESVTGVGSSGSESFPIVRIFRPEIGCYTGRLHEQAVHRQLGRYLLGPRLPEFRFRHSGYLQERLVGRDKRKRNLALAELDAVGTDSRGAGTLFANKARAALAAREFVACLEACREGLAAQPSGSARRTLLRCAASAELGNGGEPDEVLRWLDELRAASASQLMADAIEIRLRLRQGEFELALACAERSRGGGLDDDGFGHPPHELVAHEVKALSALGRHGEAADRLLAAVDGGELRMHLVDAVAVLQSAGREVGELVAVLDESSWHTVSAQLLHSPPEVADATLEAMWQRRPGDPHVLAVVARTAPRFSVLRALEWSARLRAYAQAENCPLVAIAGAGGRTPRDRVLAAAVAIETFGDERGYEPFALAVPQVPDSDAPAVLAELQLLAPELAAGLSVVPAG